MAYGLLLLCAYKIVTFQPAPLKDDPITPRPITWNTLRLLDYQTGRVPSRLQRYDGIHVRVPGFMIPLEDTTGMVSEFLLVPSLTGCIHAPPPPPNQVIHVKMDKPVPYTWQPLWVAGKLEITRGASTKAEFRMSATESAAYHGVGLQVRD